MFCRTYQLKRELGMDVLKDANDPAGRVHAARPPILPQKTKKAKLKTAAGKTSN